MYKMVSFMNSLILGRFGRLLRGFRLQCVNGDWPNSMGSMSLQGLACESCLQVGATGYGAFDQRNEQARRRDWSKGR